MVKCVTKLDIVLIIILSSFNHNDRLGVCHIFGQKSLKSLNHFSLFFQKTRIKDFFKFLTPDFDICLNILQLQILKRVLFLNGISIVVVINGWLKQYVINLTKLDHA